MELPRQIPMTDKARKAAKSLAISYLAFSEASAAFDSTATPTRVQANSLSVWGRSLLKDQAATGVQLHRPDVVSRQVDAADRVLGILAAEVGA